MTLAMPIHIHTGEPVMKLPVSVPYPWIAHTAPTTINATPMSTRTHLMRHTYTPRMDTDALLAFVRFHRWANQRIFETAAELSDGELRGDAPLDHGTAFQTLRHLVDVDWSWREFCTGNDVGEAYVWDRVPMEDLVSVETFGAEEDARLLAYVGSLDSAALAEPLALDAEMSVPRWLIVAHVVNHGTQHRSELARFFTDRGHSPGELDLIDALTL